MKKLLVALAVSVVLVGCSKPTPAERAERYCSSENERYYQVVKLVRGELKNPSAAEFGSIRETRSAYMGDCRFTTVGHVTSTNSFGAKVQVNYSAQTWFDGSNFILESFD